MGNYLNNHFTQNGFLNNPNKKIFKIELINVSKNNYAAKINDNLNYYIKEIKIFDDYQMIEPNIKFLKIDNLKWYGNSLKNNECFSLDLKLNKNEINKESQKKISKIYLELSTLKT